MIRLSIFLSCIILRIHAAADPVTNHVDPKHELLTEIAGRYRNENAYMSI